MESLRWFKPAVALALLVALGGAVFASAATAYVDPNSATATTLGYGESPTNLGALAPARFGEAPAIDRVHNGLANEAIIIDHSSTDITAVPQEWIEQAKLELHIAYGHTSHGSQLITGMAGLIGFANNGGLGLELPQDIFAFNSGGTGGALDLREPFSGDAGYYPAWVNSTVTYLGTPDPVTGRGMNHPEINVVIWAWCGQVSGYTEQQMLDQYLLPMTQLEQYYPGITFVYMTGHADGTGEAGNLHLRNQQIRNYCIENDKVLYDFYHIELHDPDEAYFGDKAVNDNCDYDSDGNGTRDKNWAMDWQNTHTQGVDWYDCYCAHSQSLNCNQKAYAAWWLWARLAGWDGGTQAGPQKTASTETAVPGQTVTYTITVRDIGAPVTATVYLTDEVPTGLLYVPGTLTATAGIATDTDAPSLRWVGVLSPTSLVTVTFGAIVDTVEPQIITNSAVIASPGYEPITVTAPIAIDGLVNASFVGSPTSGLAPLPVLFTNESSGDYDSCAWDFGDGSSGDDCENPTHTYYSSGVYTVALTVSGPGGTDTLIREGYITLYEPVNADFAGSPTSGTRPLSVSFDNSSTGDYTTCAWDFGDGGTSSDCNDPSHTYMVTGIYTVTLVINGPGGADVLTRPNYVTVVEPPPVADFAAHPLAGHPPLTVTFADTSSGLITAWLWDMGDGGISTEPSPTHVYSYTGDFTVTLTVTGPGGTDTAVKSHYIRVSELPVIANFTGDPTAGPAPLHVQFTDESSGDHDTCAWSFGDGAASNSCGNPLHTYTATGTYTVSLTVSGLGGTDSLTRTRYITVDQSIEPGLTIQGYATNEHGLGFPDVEIYHSLAGYPGVLVATTDLNGFYQSDFLPIPGDEVITVWAEREGYVFDPEQYQWQHYYGYELKTLDFAATRTTYRVYLPIVLRSYP